MAERTIEMELNPGYLFLTLVTALLVLGLIALLESVVMQLLRWGPLKPALFVSLVMNLVASVVTFPVLANANRYGTPSLLAAWAISVIIDSLILMRFKKGHWKQNWLVSVLANTASLFILILPAFQFASL